MRFKQFLIESSYEDFLNSRTLRNELVLYLMEMKVISHDDTIKKISPYHYTFTVNNVKYSFKIEYLEYLPNEIIYTVYFGPNNGMDFERINNHNLIQVRKVFEKVITCMIYFIKDLKPARFTFSGHDEKLYKTYKMIIARVYKKDPFYQYEISNGGFTFTRKQQ
jgi:hypothetical protein